MRTRVRSRDVSSLDNTSFVQRTINTNDCAIGAIRAHDPGYRLAAATGIHRGDRAYQQDQVQIMHHPRVPGCVLGVLADGMGGKSGGRKAADQVLLTAQQLFERYAPETRRRRPKCSSRSCWRRT